MKINNLFAGISVSPEAEQFDELLHNDNIRVERIVSYGHNSPEDYWYDQPEQEWVLLVKGRAKLLFKDSTEEVELTQGSWLNIPAHAKHRVTWTAPNEETIWLAIHYM